MRRLATFFGFGVLVLVAVWSARDPGQAPTADPVAVARRAPLEVTIDEPGTLEAARSVTLASEIRSNRAKIVWMLPDGSRVEAGDPVVRFDATPFEEERAKLAGELRDAEAELARLAQERKLQLAKAEERLQSTRQDLGIAELNLSAFEEGTGALHLREAEVRAEDARAELARARRELADLEAMVTDGYVSKGEVERHRSRVAELERRSGLEGERLDAEREVVFPRDRERAKRAVADAKEALARAEAVLYHTHEFYAAAIKGAEHKVETRQGALRRAEEELAKTELRAPIGGFVVLQDIPFDGGRRKPQVGDSVWSGQGIATIPDLSRMVVLTRIREIDLHRIREGLSARVAIEAFPDLELDGTIDWMGTLAEPIADSPWKVFTVRLALAGSDPRLRPGMSARVSFLIDAVETAVVIPLDAVFSRGGREVSYVRRGHAVWEQPVRLGRKNDTHVEVLAGVETGEEVLVARPTGKVRRSPSSEPEA